MWLCGHLDIPLHKTIIVGDADNDAQGCLWIAGLSVAMAMPLPHIKELCDVVVADNDSRRLRRGSGPLPAGRGEIRVRRADGPGNRRLRPGESDTLMVPLWSCTSSFAIPEPQSVILLVASGAVSPVEPVKYMLLVSSSMPLP